MKEIRELMELFKSKMQEIEDNKNDETVFKNILNK